MGYCNVGDELRKGPARKHEGTVHDIVNLHIYRVHCKFYTLFLAMKMGAFCADFMVRIMYEEGALEWFANFVKCQDREYCQCEVYAVRLKTRGDDVRSLRFDMHEK